MSRRWIPAALAASFWAAASLAQPAMEHGDAAPFDPTSFQTQPQATNPMVLAGPGPGEAFESGQEFAGPGFGPSPPAAPSGARSQGGAPYGGAPVLNEFQMTTAGPNNFTVRPHDSPDRFVYPPPDGRYFQPFDLSAAPSAPSQLCRNGDCFGHNSAAGLHLRNSDPNATPLAQLTHDNPVAQGAFQQTAARAHQTQDDWRAVPHAWTPKSGVLPEHQRFDRYMQERQQHPNQMGNFGYQFPGTNGKTLAHVDPTWGVPQRVDLVDQRGNVVGQGTWQGLYHNKWDPLNADGKTLYRDGYGVVRVDPRQGQKDSQGYIFTYNPQDPVQRAAAEKFQANRNVIPANQAFPMPEFSSDAGWRQLFHESPKVPLQQALHANTERELMTIGKAPSQRNTGIGFSDRSD